jgi:hypothetical protein
MFNTMTLSRDPNRDSLKTAGRGNHPPSEKSVYIVFRKLKQKVRDFSVPSRDVTYKTLPGRE